VTVGPTFTVVAAENDRPGEAHRHAEMVMAFAKVKAWVGVAARRRPGS
jgi:hypothetical protein